MKIYLLKYTEGGEKLMAVAGFGTRSKNPAAEITPSAKGIERIIHFAVDKHHSSLLDFPYYILSIDDVSRSFTHQWVRYRMAAHLQQSLRHVEIDPAGFDWFVTPPSILEMGSQAIIDYINTQKAAGKFYDKYVHKDVPKEDARFALPIGTKTHISSAFNAEEYLHIISQRTCFDAQWEIRTVAHAIMLAGMIVHPKIFKKAGAPCITEGKCVGDRRGKCEEKTRDIKEELEKMSDRLRDEFTKLNAGEEMQIDLTEKLGYRPPQQVKETVWDAFDTKPRLDWEVKLIVRKNWIPKVTSSSS